MAKITNVEQLRAFREQCKKELEPPEKQLELMLFSK